MISRIALFSGLFLIGCGGATLDPTGADASDGGTQQDSGTVANECPDVCPASELTWGPNGGLSSFNPSSTLDCSAYRYDQSSDSGDLSCTDTLSLSCTSSAITTPKVAQAFFNADVVAAFAGSTNFYGSDPRGCDGTVLDITFKDKTIEVGGDCSNGNTCGGVPSNACVPVPAGLSAFATLLQQLDTQELKTTNCASVFPGR
jgi:hypothetical protein